MNDPVPSDFPLAPRPRGRRFSHRTIWRLAFALVFTAATVALLPPVRGIVDPVYREGQIADRDIAAPFALRVPLSGDDLRVARARASLAVPPMTTLLPGWTKAPCLSAGTPGGSLSMVTGRGLSRIMSSGTPVGMVPTATRSAATPVLMAKVPLAAAAVPLRTIFLLAAGSSVKLLVCVASPS